MGSRTVDLTSSAVLVVDVPYTSSTVFDPDLQLKSSLRQPDRPRQD